MKIKKRAIGKVYEIKCSNCGSILECEEEYDIVWMRCGCTGQKGAKIHCPVCDEVSITKWRDIEEKIEYEDTEDDCEGFEEVED